MTTQYEVDTMSAKDRFANRMAQVGEEVVAQGAAKLAGDLISGLSDGIRGLFGGGSGRPVATAFGGDFEKVMREASSQATRHPPHFPDDTGCFITVPSRGCDVKVMALLIQGKLIVKTAPLSIPAHQVPDGFGNYLTLRNGQHAGNGAWCVREAGGTVDVSFTINEHWSGLTASDIATMLATVSREFAEVMSRY